jgi:archaellum biogenesis ATPase FlaH
MADLGQTKTRQSLESMEKYFFAYIMENPKFFQRVEPMNFKNSKIKFIFERIRNNYVKQEKPVVPSNHKVLELIRLDDPDAEAISNDFLKGLLNVDIGNLVQGADDDYLKKSFYSWCTYNNMKSKMYEAIDWIRDMNEIDYNNTESIANKLREVMANVTLMNYDDENIGLDFFDPESHVQDTNHSKIPTGWHSIDELLNGGWSRKTLNIIVGGSNSGKSLWLGNIGVNAAEHGKNVLYVTLEMGDKEVIKRMGSKWLKIPIDEYDNKSKDKVFMQRKLKELTTRAAQHAEDNLFNPNMGRIYVKEFPSGSCSVDDVDNHIKHLEETKNIKIDMVVLDYLTIMQPEKGDGTLFSNGKYLSNGLRAIAQIRDLVMVTAMQIGKDAQNAPDINMADISESKAIYENADCIFGIIRTDAMRRENKYILKLLKLRNGSFKWEKTHFELNTTYLSIENDKKLDFNN